MWGFGNHRKMDRLLDLIGLEAGDQARGLVMGLIGLMMACHGGL